MKMGLQRLWIASYIVIVLLYMLKVVSAETYDNADDILSYVDIEGRQAYKFIYSSLLQRTAQENDVSDTVKDNTNTQNLNSRQIEKGPNGIVTWPNATIPYQIDYLSYNDKSKVKAAVEQAMHIWSQETCVKFLNIDDTEHVDWRSEVGNGHFVKISNGPGCVSLIGRVEYGSTEDSSQKFNLNEKGCLNIGTVLHELGHTLGLVHEQSRKDRNEYVHINIDNINSKYKNNFDMADTLDLAQYDYNSIMHYGIKAFSSGHLDSISLNDLNLKFLAGQRKLLTFYDIKAINLAYKCDAACTTEQECKNDGYIGPQCQCVCPYTLGGIDCTDISEEWQDEGCDSGVSKVFEDDTVEITSPNYPYSYGHKKCAWLVKGPSGQKISISVLVDDIPRNQYTHKCYHNVEIRFNLLAQRGISFCGSSKFPYTVESANDSVLIILHADNLNYAGKSFKIILGTGNKKHACISSPCQTSGQTCVEGEGPVQYSCECLDNFVGPTCSAVDFILCTFDVNEGPLAFCLFKQNLDDDLQWSQRSNPTPTRYTGPRSDMSGHGMYLYIESSTPARGGHTAVLDSYLIASGEKCFSLFYNMYGAQMGELYVTITSEVNPQWTHTWMKAGDHGTDWKHALISINSTTDFRIHIKAVRGSSYRSDMAIDAVSLTNELCYTVGNTTITSYNISSDTEGDCPLFYTGPKCDLIYEAFCTFDSDDMNDLCVFSNNRSNQYNWQKHKGITETGMTGPSDDVSGNKYYLYTKASAPAIKGFVANLESDYIQGGTVCISYQLHMYGNNIGEVNVHFEDISNHVHTIERSAVNSNKWIKFVFQVTSADTFKMTIQSVRGSGKHGDVGFDDFKLSRENCYDTANKVKLS